MATALGTGLGTAMSYPSSPPHHIRPSHRHSTSATAPGPPRYRHRSNSRDSRSSSQGRLPPRSPSPAGEGHGDVGTFLGPLPSVLPPLPFPLGSRPPRFNPTAFVRAREQRRQEAELRRSVVPQPCHSALTHRQFFWRARGRHLCSLQQMIPWVQAEAATWDRVKC